MKNSTRLTQGWIGIIAAAILWIGGPGVRADTPAVGPKPPAANEPIPRVGYLKVYSATEEHDTGDNTYVYPHTDYNVFDLQGRRVLFVDNGGPSRLNEEPVHATLPEGSYVVRADSDAGRVHVPVVIRMGRTTVLHLEKSNWKPAAGARTVSLPGGGVIGYAAD